MIKKTRTLEELTQLWQHYREQLRSANREATTLLQSHLTKIERPIQSLKE